jgi:hypothetical protein
MVQRIEELRMSRALPAALVAELNNIADNVASILSALGPDDALSAMLLLTRQIDAASGRTLIGRDGV